MNEYGGGFKGRTWFMAAVLAVFLAGCGSGDDLFGTTGTPGTPGTPGAGGSGAVTIIPGAVCTVAAGPTIPTATSSDPTSGNQFVTTSTTGVAGSGKLITATFSLAMNAATINATTFTLAPVGGAVLVPASVSYNASTRVATLTTSSALLPDTSYTAIITLGATSAAGTAIACSYAWNFKTVTPAAAGIGPVNMGLATPFAIAATAGVVNAPTAPITTIDGNVVLDPNQTCNSVTVPNDGTFGGCGGSPPVLNGQVITNTFPNTTDSAAIKADLNTAFLSITPPAGPPAVGTLGGGATIAAPTTLGDVAGNPLVLGDNYFTPGVYTSPGAINISGDFTLDGQGDANAVFVFQAGSTLNIAAGAVSPGPHTRILLVGGAKASNVWWQVGSSATIGTFAEFYGNVLAAFDITMENGATSCGRMMSGAWVGGSGALIFEANLVSIPGHPNAPPGCE